MGAASIRSLFALLLAAICCTGAFATAAGPLQEAQRLLSRHQLQPALDRVDQIIAATPGDAQARFLKGLILAEMNRPEDAIAEFRRLSEDYPELPEPYNNMAVIYARTHQYEKAKSALEMAIRAHPGYGTAYENLGDIYVSPARPTKRPYSSMRRASPPRASWSWPANSLRHPASPNRPRERRLPPNPGPEQHRLQRPS